MDVVHSSNLPPSPLTERGSTERSFVPQVVQGWAMANKTPIVDAQVHAYERDHEGRPWSGVLAGPQEVTGDDLVDAMDAVGVDGALLVSPWTMYRFDASYARDVHAAHPGRFGLIKPVDPQGADVAEVVADWAATEGAVGARIMLIRGLRTGPDDVGVNNVLAAGARHGLPINLLCWGVLPVVDELARRNPNTRIVVDHLGLHQPFKPPAPDEPWSDLEAVLALARHDNVAVKVTGACTLSHEAFPYLDLWPPLNRLFDAFGFDRLMWGTDWTRAVDLLSYEQGVESFRTANHLSADDRAALMGGSLSRIYGWTPSMP